MQIIFSILISLAVLIAGVVGVVNYTTLGGLTALSFSKPLFGTDLTTITSATKISDLATILPNNFNALNNGKIETSTTSLPLITTLAGLTTALNLSSIGTIATGVWSGTAISVSKGGTGTTSPTLHMVILGNGSSGFKVVDGFGTSGQFLTSNGTGAAPTWQTSAVDQGIAYNWTGLHSWSQLTTFASSTFSATSTFNGRITSDTASTTVYNDLKVMGSFSVGGITYGRKYPCVGAINIAGSGGTGWKTTAVACDFQPAFVQFEAKGSSGQTSSFGVSNTTNSYANAYHCITTTCSRFTSSTSSVSTFYVSGGNRHAVYGSSTPTVTGFNFNYIVDDSASYGDTNIIYSAY